MWATCINDGDLAEQWILSDYDFVLLDTNAPMKMLM